MTPQSDVIYGLPHIIEGNWTVDTPNRKEVLNFYSIATCHQSQPCPINFIKGDLYIIFQMLMFNFSQMEFTFNISLSYVKGNRTIVTREFYRLSGFIGPMHRMKN